MIDWLTNDPEAARLLRRATSRYHAARLLAVPLPLQEKVAALRAARASYHSECATIATKLEVKHGIAT